MADVPLPVDFINQMKHLLGDESTSLFKALCTPPAYRGIRLHRWTSQGLADGGAHVLTDATIAPSIPYAISQVTPVPEQICSRLEEPVPWMRDGFYIPHDSSLGKTIYHEAGAFYLQEPSAMAVATALDVKPGERILDLCAAPGGKTTALARALAGQGVLAANEIHPKRVVTLAQNLERLGVPAIITNESPQRLADEWNRAFDAVLVDAPCSGEGMFRKDSVAREEWTADSPQVCAKRQREILTAAVQLVRPGGRLVYSTCTLNPTENEQVVAWAIRHLPVELRPLPNWPGWSEGKPEWADNTAEIAMTRRLWPHIGAGEGHFVASFRILDDAAVIDAEDPVATRGAASQSNLVTHRGRLDRRMNRGAKINEPRGKSASRSNSLREQWLQLAQELLTSVPNAWTNIVTHKDLVFAAPPADLSFGDLKVLRPGVCLAEAISGRMQPHHSLAMAILPSLVRNRVELSPEQAVDYLAGLTLPITAAAGWNWLFADGLVPLGWGKGVPGRVNNLYPRGLRRQGLRI